MIIPVIHIVAKIAVFHKVSVEALCAGLNMLHPLVFCFSGRNRMVFCQILRPLDLPARPTSAQLHGIAVMYAHALNAPDFSFKSPTSFMQHMF
jgi:hypothetical protein